MKSKKKKVAKKLPIKKDPSQQMDGGNFLVVDSKGYHDEHAKSFEDAVKIAKDILRESSYHETFYIFEAKPVAKVERAEAQVTKLN